MRESEYARCLVGELARTLATFDQSDSFRLAKIAQKLQRLFRSQLSKHIAREFFPFGGCITQKLACRVIQPCRAFFNHRQCRVWYFDRVVRADKSAVISKVSVFLQCFDELRNKQ